MLLERSIVLFEGSLSAKFSGILKNLTRFVLSAGSKAASQFLNNSVIFYLSSSVSEMRCSTTGAGTSTALISSLTSEEVKVIGFDYIWGTTDEDC